MPGRGLFAGGSAGNPASGLLGSLLGQPPIGRPPVSPAPNPGRAPALAPLPTLRLENGRLHFGPFQIPGVRLAPLY